jgi:hypothetical protein
MTEQDKDQLLDQAIAGLPRELLPEQDLWLQLEPQLQQRSKKPFRFAGVNRAWAAAVVTGLLGVLIWRSMLIPENGTSLPDQSTAGEWIPAEQLIVEEYETIKAQKLGDIGRVSEDYGDWKYQLAVWDEAIGQVHEALQYYPNDPALWSQIQGLYQQQLGYLQQISAIDVNEFSL